MNSDSVDKVIEYITFAIMVVAVIFWLIHQSQ